ncbi:hypothetical protein ACLB2K_022729 [Fragaria x ananassa]
MKKLEEPEAIRFRPKTPHHSQFPTRPPICTIPISQIEPLSHPPALRTSVAAHPDTNQWDPLGSGCVTLSMTLSDPQNYCGRAVLSCAGGAILRPPYWSHLQAHHAPPPPGRR